MPAWRARAHHLTRSRAFLAKATAVVLGVFMLIAVVVHVTRPSGGGPTPVDAALKARTTFKGTVHEGVKRLEALKEPAPDRLIAWIREVAAWWMHDEAARKGGFDAVALRVSGVELHPLIAKHTVSGPQAEAVTAYVRFRFLAEGEARKTALDELDKVTKESSPPHAGELLGDALLICDRSEEALQAYLRDVATPASSYARRSAMELALNLQDLETLKKLCGDPRVIADNSSETLWRVGKRTGDRHALFHGLWQNQWARWTQGAGVPLALLAAAIWYIILIHSASRETLRWWRYLPAVFAGVASVWMLKWWQGTLNYYQAPEDAPSMTHEVLRWIMHVGLPEEAAKLLLFVFFLPVLLHNKSGVKAALTAGCVGLGFALNENLLYFREGGPDRAIGRLLTANFMHVSLTGVVGWHLYQLFRTRFHHATEFLIAFSAVVVAHGVYDFCTGGAASKWGFDFFGLVILALCARFYLHLLHENERVQPAGFAISRTSVFVLGTALLGGVLMVVMVWQRESLDGITLVLKQMVGLALIGLFYVREWKEI